MATWTTPKTWNVGDILTAADMNTYLRDNTGLIPGFGVTGQPYGPNAKTPGLNVAQYVKVWLTRLSITTFNINIDTSAGNLDVGIYADSSGVPGAKLWALGSTASPGTGHRSFNISAGTPTSLTPSGGPGWLAVATNSATFALKSASGAPAGIARSQSSAFPLPATAGSSDDSDMIAAILL